MRERACTEHAALNAKRGDQIVEPVDGPVARLSEWGRSRGEYPDGCPGHWSAHYTLTVAGEYIGETSEIGAARVMRQIAVTLNNTGTVIS